MDPVVIRAATTLVRLTASDEWSGARDVVVDWWHRHDLGDAGQVGADLDRLRGEVAAAGDDRQLPAALAVEWQLRLRRVITANPALAVELSRLVAEQLVPLLTAAAAVQDSAVTGDGNTTIQAGGDARTLGQRSIAIDTGGGAFRGTAATGDRSWVVHAAGATIGAIGDHNTQVNHFQAPGGRPVGPPADPVADDRTAPAPDSPS
ncbi:hypothetical protein [Nocardia aurantia]|uniref:Uncharacterized protein n=1 Tax=Nocardia aurantia TaxID=2585199 RepID=A0A7K0E1G9_9NOCA|nr:hypothetical protein [Nocardia aurantia]MQY31933.1 hypothetical protein [Nocardia aurantia]